MAAQSPRIICVTIRYDHAGAEPPIYLAGSFSQPQWQPQEMDYTKTKENEYKFHKDVQVEEGKEYQYKFRVGNGDWWALNMHAPVVNDNIGNCNNLLVIPTGKEIQAVSASIECQHENNEGSFLATTQCPVSPSAARQGQIVHVKEPKPDVIGYGDAPKASLARSKQSSPIAFGGRVVSLDLEQIERSGVLSDGPEAPGAVSPPDFVVNKADTKSQLGNSLSADSVTSQQITNNPHVADNGQNLTELRIEALAPELVSVIAEVTDSVATLDRVQPTPPIADEEAGRIGLKGMSSTLTLELAGTATEAAYTGAGLDRENLSLEDFFPKPSGLETNESLESGSVPPWGDKALLFPSRNPSPNEKVVQRTRRGFPPRLPSSSSIIAADASDHNDPSLQKFPTVKVGMLSEPTGIERQSPVDNCLVGDILPLSSGCQPPLTEPAIPSLLIHPVAEENELRQALPALTDGSEAPCISNKKPSYASRSSDRKAEIEQENQEVSLQLAHEQLASPEENSAYKTIKISLGFQHVNPEKLLIFERIQPKSSAIGAELVNTNSSSELQDPPSHSGTMHSTECTSSDAAVRQLVGNECIREISTKDENPNITIRPATPSSSTKTKVSTHTRDIKTCCDKCTDAEKHSTAATGIGQSQLISRKQRRSASPGIDRPITPTSIRSSHKGFKTRNFLKTFFQVVFVDWIGGLIMRLCGGGHHK